MTYLKRLLLVLVSSLAIGVPLAVSARVNPAVSESFFLLLASQMPRSQPAPVGQQGDVTEVTLPGLAWAVDNLKNDPQPLVVEFYSSDSQDCYKAASATTDECTLQQVATPAAAAHYAGRVKFLRIDVKANPVLLAGPDVRVLPAHMVIASYTDRSHYTASKVGGYLSATQLESLIHEDLGIDP